MIQRMEGKRDDLDIQKLKFSKKESFGYLVFEGYCPQVFPHFVLSFGDIKISLGTQNNLEIRYTVTHVCDAK